jgi:micrococcal nuclease
MRARRHPLLSFLLLVFALGVWAPASLAQKFSGKVIGITDGNTITVLRDRTPIKIRLQGIDCPELGRDFGSRAQRVTSELSSGQVVKVKAQGLDRYGRTLAGVFLPEGRSLNQELVRQGFAWWHGKYTPHDSTLSGLQAEARAAKRGLWSQPNPIPPWKWRERPLGTVPAELQGKVIGNKRSKVYHLPGCKNVASMSPGNRVLFDTAKAAMKAGFRPGKDCHPRTP